MSEQQTEQDRDRRAAEAAREILRAHPDFDEVRLLEEDETVPPRPEEEIADAARD